MHHHSLKVQPHVVMKRQKCVSFRFIEYIMDLHFVFIKSEIF